MCSREKKIFSSFLLKGEEILFPSCLRNYPCCYKNLLVKNRI